jgi:hypothetical protein
MKTKERKKEILLRAISDFNLNLSGLTVFTEIASGNYAYTAICSILAGATKTIGLVKDSFYSSSEDVLKNFYDLVYYFNIKEKSNWSVVFYKDIESLSKSDIITNSGFLRPISKRDIDLMKETAVIPLMFESWEFDKSCIDFSFCKEKGILVLGTNEHYYKLDLFGYIPYKICKLIFDSGMSLYKNKILLLSSGEVGDRISNFFSLNNICFDRFCFDKKFNYDLSKYDILIISELYFKEDILSKTGIISSEKLKEENPSIKIIYTYGLINRKDILEEDLLLFPNSFRNVTGDYLCPEITIRLNVASLKVAEIAARKRLQGLPCNEVLDFISSNDLVDIGLYR